LPPAAVLHSQNKVIKCAGYVIAQARGWKYGWMGGRRERVRGECGFKSLVKQKIKGKIYFVIHIAGEKILLFYFYFVIVKQNFINGHLITTKVCAYRASKCMLCERERERARAIIRYTSPE
jgi:hypothetical protein